MKAEPVYMCYKHICGQIQERNQGTAEGGKLPVRVVYLTPQGRTFCQKLAEEYAGEEDIIFLCGHYEGIDERVIEEIVTDYVSIGDYVLTGGELPALVMMDAISRLVPGVLNNCISAQTESFLAVCWNIHSIQGQNTGVTEVCHLSFCLETIGSLQNGTGSSQ